MDIIVGITMPDGLEPDHVKRIEEEVVHRIVADNTLVMSAVILRPYGIGPSRLWDSGTGYSADEHTRQSR